MNELKKSSQNNQSNLRRTLIYTSIISLVVIFSVSFIQIFGQSKIAIGCSYLDPITIDFLAFLAALFLVVEGFARIIEHPHASLKHQATRIIRISFGFAILTLHLIQFIHK